VSHLSGAGLTRKHETRLERQVRDKHSSLLQTFITCRRKRFYNIGPWEDVRIVVDGSGPQDGHWGHGPEGLDLVDVIDGLLVGVQQVDLGHAKILKWNRTY
jgi:hypothetical protein